MKILFILEIDLSYKVSSCFNQNFSKFLELI